MSRGRQAETPTEIPAAGWKDIALRVKDEISADRVGLIAAGVAFYGLLALFPAVGAVMAIAGLLVDPNRIVEQLQGLSALVPEDVLSIVIDQATAVAGSQEAGLGLTALIGFLLAIYSASKGMASLMEGMNVAYDETEERGFFVRTAITLALTLFLVFGLIVALMAIIGIPAILATLSLGPVVEVGGTILAYLVVAALTLIGLAVVYRYGPSRDSPELKWVSVGAIAALVLWAVGSAGFAFYVGNFGSYNETFGTVAGVVVLLMWFWISAYIILMGAELNSEMEAQTRHDTTVGRDQPMGERDAEKADNLGRAKGRS
ncbi:MAG: YihY/virulence factor BrkB family protein [Jannaschia sp.]